MFSLTSWTLPPASVTTFSRSVLLLAGPAPWRRPKVYDDRDFHACIDNVGLKVRGRRILDDHLAACAFRCSFDDLFHHENPVFNVLL